MTLSYLQLFSPLVFILLMIAGAAWLIKRLNQPRSLHAKLMTVQSSVAVGPRERIVLLEVADQWLVLGITPGNINTLLTLPAQALPESEPKYPDKAHFTRSWLERYTRQI